MSVGISLAIIGSVAFGGAILWLTYELVSAPTEDRWADFKDRSVTRDQQYRDRIASGSKSFREALALSDNECGDWPLITEEELISIHEGRHR